MHSQPPNPAAPTSAWQVEFTLSGGLAGTARALDLSSTGQLKVVDRRTRRQVVTKLPGDELAGISALLVDVSHLTPTGSPPACRDCFDYDLTVRMDGEVYVFHVNDLNVDQAGLAPLVSALRNLQERALAGQGQPHAPG
jgi:hypothetical protein